MTDSYIMFEGRRPVGGRLRDILRVSIMLIAVVGVGVYFYVKFMPTVSSDENDSLLLPTKIVNSDQEQIGGDIYIVPPHVVGPRLPELTGELPPPDLFSADSIIVKDVETGVVLYKKNEYVRHSIASITKLLSALVLLELDLKWDSVARVPKDNVIDNHMYAGEMYTLNQLFTAGLVASSNKAILALVDACGLNRKAFHERMNQKAMELGMTDSQFVESTGLDKGNVASASDVVLLLDEALRHEKIRNTLLAKEYTLYTANQEKSHHISNTNWLLLDWVSHDFKFINGGKTGYITASDYNFTVQLESEAGYTLNIAILGAKGHKARFTEARDVANHIFDNYSWPYNGTADSAELEEIKESAIEQATESEKSDIIEESEEDGHQPSVDSDKINLFSN